MKTKHLLTALALPALFAACTADDIETVSVNPTERVALNENFKMNFGGVESRLSTGEPGAALKYEFEEGDMVGAAVIDKYAPTGAPNQTLDNKYPVQFYASANQPWTYDGAEWTINHTQVEGKYLFYYPYNEANNSRGAVQYSIPVMQELSDADGKFDPKAAVEKYAMSIGYQFITADDLTASAELYPIFANARIIANIDNAYAGGEVEKIVLQTTGTTGETFKLAGQLNHKEVERIFKLSKTSETFKWSDYATTAAFALKGTESEVAGFYEAEKQVESTVVVGKVPAGVKLTTDAQGIKTFETYMVVPAQTLNNPLNVYLYTTDGRVFVGSVNVPAFKCNVTKRMEVEMTLSTAGDQAIIASQKDWNESVEKMKDNTTFIIADPDFTITNDMKYHKDYTITVNGNVNVSGNDVTMKNVTATTITVLEGAKLTTDVTAKANIVNKGTVVVAKNPEARAILPYTIGKIENHATLTIAEDAEISTLLTNKKGATVANAGALTLVGTSGENYGTITNTGSITINAAAAVFENGLREYKKDSDGKFTVLVNEPTITNEGRIRVNNGKLNNYSVITNKGILSCANGNGGVINNYSAAADSEGNVVATKGIIDAVTGSTTFITDNTGKVKVYSMTQADVASNGVIEYVATTASVLVDDSDVTDIIATGNIEIKHTNVEKPGSFKKLIVRGVSEIKMTYPATVTTLPSFDLVVESGKAIIKTDKMTVSSLTIAKNASVSVPDDITFTVALPTQDEAGKDIINLSNKGVISVEGILNVKGYKEGAIGDVDDNGNATINYKNDNELAVAAAKKAYQDAMLPALKEWVAESAKENWTYDFDVFNYNLNDSTTNIGGKTGVYGTDEAFAKFVSYYTGKDTKAGILNDAFKEYVKLNDKAKMLDYYSTAVDSYVTELKEAANYVKDMKTFEEITITPTTANIFIDNDKYVCTDGSIWTMTAEEYALEAFKDEVAKMSLKKETKMVLCASTSYDDVKTYVPDYAYAFVSDNVYKIYKDYIVKYGMTGPSVNNLETLKKWISNRANWTEKDLADKTAGEKKLHNFITTNNFEVYDESLEWAYTDATIAEIAKVTGHVTE